MGLPPTSGGIWPRGTWVPRSTGGWPNVRANLPAWSRRLNRDDPPRHTSPRDDRYGLREGEVAVELPAQFDASLYYIGRIRTPWKRREDCPKNARESDAVCTVELDPRWAEGLTGLETVSHVMLLYWMDQARRDLVLQSPRHYAEHRGTFALRSPARPNPIAVSVARLVRIDGNTLSGRRRSTASTTRRSSTSSRISPRPIPCRTPSVGWHAARKR